MNFERLRDAFTAEGSSPHPRGSFGMDALVAISIFAVALFFFGRFYSVDVLDHPFLAMIGGGAVCLSIHLRLLRMRRHKASHQTELRKADGRDKDNVEGRTSRKSRIQKAEEIET